MEVIRRGTGGRFHALASFNIEVRFSLGVVIRSSILLMSETLFVIPIAIVDIKVLDEP